MFQPSIRALTVFWLTFIWACQCQPIDISGRQLLTADRAGVKTSFLSILMCCGGFHFGKKLKKNYTTGHVEKSGARLKRSENFERGCHRMA